MKKSELPKHIQERLETMSVGVGIDLDYVIGELEDLKAQLYGGYSKLFDFVITADNCTMQNPEAQTTGVHKDLTIIANRVRGLAKAMARYDTVIEVATEMTK